MQPRAEWIINCYRAKQTIRIKHFHLAILFVTAGNCELKKRLLESVCKLVCECLPSLTISEVKIYYILQSEYKNNTKCLLFCWRCTFVWCLCVCACIVLLVWVSHEVGNVFEQQQQVRSGESNSHLCETAVCYPDALYDPLFFQVTLNSIHDNDSWQRSTCDRTPL